MRGTAYAVLIEGVVHHPTFQGITACGINWFNTNKVWGTKERRVTCLLCIGLIKAT